ncbi:hypothetical protein J6590_015994 [Homalodisca vitripennis]|nr:hypothetical protein J6590_015994 [Homalodisca vitripennis]
MTVGRLSAVSHLSATIVVLDGQSGSGFNGLQSAAVVATLPPVPLENPSPAPGCGIVVHGERILGAERSCKTKPLCNIVAVV